MANVATATVTLASASASTAILLDPTARATTLLLYGTGVTSTSTQGAVSDVTIQVTLDTFRMQSTTFTWNNLSTTHYSLGTGSTATLAADGAFISVLGPIGGVRLYSTGWGASSGTAYLKALQSVTAGP